MGLRTDTHYVALKLQMAKALKQENKAVRYKNNL